MKRPRRLRLKIALALLLLAVAAFPYGWGPAIAGCVAKMDEVAADHQPEWRSLGVAILHSLVIDTLLELKGHEKPKYVHDVAEVAATLKNEPENYPLAALVMPATVQQIEDCSMVRERMPAKSTYFYPKLITGFVFKPLE